MIGRYTVLALAGIIGFATHAFAEESPKNNSCGHSLMAKAIEQIAAGNLVEFESLLTKCAGEDRDPRSLYLLGLAPRYFKIEPAEQLKYYDYLGESAAAGFGPAQSLVGQVLLNDDPKDELAPTLMKSAAEQGDEWAALYQAKATILSGQPIQKNDGAVLAQAAWNGFSPGFAVLAMDQIHWIEAGLASDDEARQESMAALAIGILMGDPYAAKFLSSKIAIFESVTPEVVNAAGDVLKMRGVDPYPASLRNIELAYGYWGHLYQQFAPSERHIQQYDLAVQFCRSGVLGDKSLRLYCELRAGIDHYVCQPPNLNSEFKRQEIVEEDVIDSVWRQSSGYRQCRHNRLTQRPDVSFF